MIDRSARGFARLWGWYCIDTLVGDARRQASATPFRPPGCPMSRSAVTFGTTQTSACGVDHNFGYLPKPPLRPANSWPRNSRLQSAIAPISMVDHIFRHRRQFGEQVDLRREWNVLLLHRLLQILFRRVQVAHAHAHHRLVFNTLYGCFSTENYQTGRSDPSVFIRL